MYFIEPPIEEALLAELGSHNPMLREAALCKARPLSDARKRVLLEWYLGERKHKKEPISGAKLIGWLRQTPVARIYGMFSGAAFPVEKEYPLRESISRLLLDVHDPLVVGSVLALLPCCGPGEEQTKRALWTVIERLLPLVPSEEIVGWTDAQRAVVREPLVAFGRLFTVKEGWPGWSSSLNMRQTTLRVKLSEVALSLCSSELICILQMIERCGEVGDIALVRPLTRLPGRTQEETRLRYAARRCVNLLVAAEQANTQAQTLLRPTEAPAIDARHLLRPSAAQANPVPASQLLRPHSASELSELEESEAFRQKKRA